MRSLNLAILSCTLLFGAAAASAAEDMAAPAALKSESKVSCRQLTHQTMLLPIVECHDEAGWTMVHLETLQDINELKTTGRSMN